MMSKQAQCKLAAAAASAAACLLIPAVALGASIGGFSVRPAHFDPAQPVTRSYFKPTIARGRSYRNQVMVTNTSARQIDLFVDPVDGVTGVTSGAVYTNRQVPNHAAGLWVTPAIRQIDIPPHGHASIGFLVHVPGNAAPGDHLAGLAFQDAQARRSPGKFSITEIVRAVVGIDIDVPGPAHPDIQLYTVGLKALPGTAYPSIVIKLSDTGRDLCKPRLAVALSGPAGSVQVARQLDTILPGDTIPYPFPWPHPLLAGHYTARIHATSCGTPATITRAAALNTALRGTTANPAGPKPVPAKSTNPPWPIILVGLGGLATGILVSRRRRPGSPPKR